MARRVTPDARHRELGFSHRGGDEMRARVGSEVLREAIAVGTRLRPHVISLLPRTTARELKGWVHCRDYPRDRKLTNSVISPGGKLGEDGVQGRRVLRYLVPDTMQATRRLMRLMVSYRRKDRFAGREQQLTSLRIFFGRRCGEACAAVSRYVPTKRTFKHLRRLDPLSANETNSDWL